MAFEVSHSSVGVEITGISCAQEPRAETALFLTQKIAGLLPNLEAVRNCLVFVQEGMEVPESLREKHTLVESANPAQDCGEWSEKLWQKKCLKEKSHGYILANGGYSVGANVQIDDGVYIEPGAVIGHGVRLGAGTEVFAGAVLKDVIVGKNCRIRENAVIGGQAFTLYQDEKNSTQRMYCLNGVVLEDEVEIGALSTVCSGLGRTTRVGSHTKIDDHVYIAHDVLCAEEVRLAGAVVIGGFCELAGRVFVGFGAAVKNRVVVGEKAVIGMGAIVTKSVGAGQTVVGNPARLLATKAVE